MRTSLCEVVIVGAGPYGLALAAHLRGAGVEHRIFGEPMEFWRRMPPKMLLRSAKPAADIGNPDGTLGIQKYADCEDVGLNEPIPLKDFAEYGQWFQRRAVPNLDRRRVSEVTAAGSGFRVILEDGEKVETRRVVIAAGVGACDYRPSEFVGLPREMASHSFDHADLSGFAGARVAVIGGGQSALESAALLIESGAEVEILVRSSSVHWVRDRKRALLVKYVRTFIHPATQVGPIWWHPIGSRPYLFQKLPGSLQRVIDDRSRIASVSSWLRPRIETAKITLSSEVVAAAALRDGLRLTLRDGTHRHIDHALLATGYQIDIARYAFLPPALLRSIKCFGGYPQLRSGFESSVPGLFFIGTTAAHSFGPLVRLICGNHYSAKAVTRAIVADMNARSPKMKVRRIRESEDAEPAGEWDRDDIKVISQHVQIADERLKS
jgi:thioredoxin reductase